MTTRIRPATARDVTGIFHVRTSVEENLIPIAQLEDMGITKASVTEMISARTCAWVAEKDDEVVGFSMIDVTTGSLFALFVLPSHQAKGIGKKLIHVAEQALFEHHATAWLETDQTTRAAGFYRSLGWGNEKDIGGQNIRLFKSRP